MTAQPSDLTGTEEHATDHQEQHRFLSPGQRIREKVAADDIGEVDADAQDQHGARGYA